ncbi:IS66 family transposase, partial [Escherichia coli]|nr:IS66 family transposase [Escherichia coli]EFN9261581.1 IS66 family transposase [Escherichia coli]
MDAGRRRRNADGGVDRVHNWLNATEKTSAPGGGSTELETYLADGRVPVNNNRCEQMIRTVAQSLKPWLFAGSLRDGKRLA